MKSKSGPLWSKTALLLAIGYAGSGTAKIVGLGNVKEAFARWGYSRRMRYLIGLSELGGSALLLSRRTARMGASGLTILMLGASGTHIIHGERLHALMPLSTLYPLARTARDTWR